jgi:Tfp pilus assembly protein PilV
VRNLNQQGITLVETVITLAFAMLLILALVSITGFNIRNSSLVFENQDAINSSNKLLENLKFVKDIDFSNLHSFPANVNCFRVDHYCTLNSNRIAATQPSGILTSPSPTSFFIVTRTSPTPSVNPLVEVNEVGIKIVTVWKIGTSNFSSAFDTILTNWRQK